MTSTPVTILHKRSGNSSDRPSGNILVNGELSINFGAADPGVYFEDSVGNIIKIGPTPYGTTAPNAAPVGLTGNSTGELWTDSNGGNYYLKVWNGSSWNKIYAGLSDTATNANQANSSTIASGALTSNTSLLASGCILASGSITANTALLASGCILASGSITANTALLASGCILASGSITANTALLASGAMLASGVVTSVGIPSVLVLLSGLPSPTSYSSGTLIYQVQSSGATPSGLFVRALNGWAFT
jgi:hypothetical protein